MRKWTDKNGDVHSVEIDIPTAERMRDELEIDLIAPLADNSLTLPLFQTFTVGLKEDPTKVVQFLTVIEEPKEPSEFGRLFDGESIVQAGIALVESVIDFFQEPQRGILRKMNQRAQEIAKPHLEAATDKAMQAIDSADFTTAVESLLTAGNGSTESSVSSDEAVAA